MSGFSPEWLELREAADHRARDGLLAMALADRLQKRPSIQVVDLGCGTGSNIRATYAALGPDSDPDALLAAITAAVPGDIDRECWRAGLVTPDDAIFWALGEGDPHFIRAARPDSGALAALLNIDQFLGDGE